MKFLKSTGIVACMVLLLNGPVIAKQRPATAHKHVIKAKAHHFKSRPAGQKKDGSRLDKANRAKAKAQVHRLSNLKHGNKK